MSITTSSLGSRKSRSLSITSLLNSERFLRPTITGMSSAKSPPPSLPPLSRVYNTLPIIHRQALSPRPSYDWRTLSPNELMNTIGVDVSGACFGLPYAKRCDYRVTLTNRDRTRFHTHLTAAESSNNSHPVRRAGRIKLSPRKPRDHGYMASSKVSQAFQILHRGAKRFRHTMLIAPQKLAPSKNRSLCYPTRYTQMPKQRNRRVTDNFDSDFANAPLYPSCTSIFNLTSISSMDHNATNKIFEPKLCKPQLVSIKRVNDKYSISPMLAK